MSFRNADNSRLACGDIGSICTSENDCYESGVAPGSCSSGVCGGVGASCCEHFIDMQFQRRF